MIFLRDKAKAALKSALGSASEALAELHQHAADSSDQVEKLPIWSETACTKMDTKQEVSWPGKPTD